MIQAGMVWCSGWGLAKASSEAGILGVLGAGSMYPDILESHLKHMVSEKPLSFAVNLPLLYPQIEDHLSLIEKYQVPVVITSAGNPKVHTARLQAMGCKVLHVVSSVKFALKAQEAGVDGIIAEGFEAGGHNGRDETTTFVLIPAVKKAVNIPVIAAGGIYSGKGIHAAMVLGADGVQLGSRFVMTKESSAHEAFKQAILNSQEGQTHLTLKELNPVRLLKNPFYQSIAEAYQKGANKEELRALLGRGRAKKGMFEGDLTEGELEIGQVSALLENIPSASDLIYTLTKEYFDSVQGYES